MYNISINLEVRTIRLTFAMITPALISGTVIGRIRMRTWIVFVVVWATILYDSVAHWVWSAWEEDGVMKYGWLRERGVLDFAGKSKHLQRGKADRSARGNADRSAIMLTK